MSRAGINTHWFCWSPFDFGRQRLAQSGRYFYNSQFWIADMAGPLRFNTLDEISLQQPGVPGVGSENRIHDVAEDGNQA
jgi:hypothetical protein